MNQNGGPLCVILGAGMILLGMATAPGQNSDGYWSKGGSGSWAVANNWDSGVIADGTDNTAYFGFSLEPAIPASATFTLDGARTIGSLSFTAQTTPANWTLNTGTGGPLTLDATFDYPAITVSPTGLQLTINTVIAGVAGMEKFGPGTLILTATNIFSGGTLVSGGTLLVEGVVTDAVTVTSGALLGGQGMISGPVTVQSGGTLEPRSYMGLTPIGTLTISNSLTLQAGSSTRIKLSPALSGCDIVRGFNGVSYGGTLAPTNLSGTLAAGQSYQIFRGTGATGNFSKLTPQLTGGLRWQFNPANGVLSVVSTGSQPQITSVSRSGTNLVLQAVNGAPGVTNYVLVATNLTLPPASWTRVATNIFDLSGNLVFTNAINPGTPQRFYLILVPATF